MKFSILSWWCFCSNPALDWEEWIYYPSERREDNELVCRVCMCSAALCLPVFVCCLSIYLQPATCKTGDTRHSIYVCRDRAGIWLTWHDMTRLFIFTKSIEDLASHELQSGKKLVEYFITTGVKLSESTREIWERDNFIIRALAVSLCCFVFYHQSPYL